MVKFEIVVPNFGMERGEFMAKRKWKNVQVANECLRSENPMNNRVITNNLQIGFNTEGLTNNMAVITDSFRNRREVISKNVNTFSGSYVITDADGELQRMLETGLIENGYTIKVLDLIELEKSFGYDPFSTVANERELVELSETIAAVVRNQYKISEEEPFMGDAIALYSKLMCALSWEMGEREKASMKDFIELIHMDIEVAKTDEMGHPVSKLAIYIEELQKIRGDECDSILSSMYNNLNFLSEPVLEAVRSAFCNMFITVDKMYTSFFKENDINIQELGTGISGDINKKMAVFIRVPMDNYRYNWIGSLFLSQCANILLRVSDNEIGGPLPIRVEFFFDDLSHECISPVKLERHLIYSKGRNLSFVLCFSSTEVLKNVYRGVTWQAILDTISIIVYTGNPYISEEEAIICIDGCEPIRDKKAF